MERVLIGHAPQEEAEPKAGCSFDPFLMSSAPTPGGWKTASVHSFKEISRRSFKVQKQTNPGVG